VQSFLRDQRVVAAELPPDSPQRLLAGSATNQPLTAGYLKLFEGAPQSALAQVTAALARIEAVKVPATDGRTTDTKNVMLEASFSAAARAAVQLGRYAQAETLARRWLALAPDSLRQTDPKPQESRSQCILAQAIAMQGRNDEARKTLQPALDYYQQQIKAGASGTTFRADYAHALYVSAIAQTADATGRKRRKADLEEAAKLIAGMSDEAQRLTTTRYVSGLIAAAPATPNG
jgi:tetratricopeptide (TPR) repeat protein